MTRLQLVPPRLGRAAVLIGVVVLAACSNLTSEERDALEVASEQAGEINSGENYLSDLDSEQLECVERFFNDRGTDFAAAVTDTDAAEDRADIGRAVFACVSEPENLDTYVAQVAGSLELGAGGVIDVSDDETRCFIAHVRVNSDDPGYTMAVADRQEDLDIALAGFEQCFSDENLAALIGDVGSGFQAYGDDARLDLMYDGCEAGDDRLCDILFLVSAGGSEYQGLAADCAGRGVGATDSCSPEAEIDRTTGFADPASPGLPILTSDCEAGDLTACDLLFLISPIDSETEEIGTTCGGLVPVGALPDCRTRLADG